MLILSRKIGQSIIALCADGSRIVVKIVRVDNTQVKVGIEAPDDGPKRVLVFREELEADFLKHLPAGDIRKADSTTSEK